jgi:hypothetical protein
LKHLDDYKSYNKINEVESINYPILKNKQKLSEKEYEVILGRKGELSKYLRKNGKKFTFGILKSIFEDAILYKKRREMIKGGYKMIHRALPMLLAYIYFPIWVLGNVLGFSRALNKILKPMLKNPETSYNKFLIKFITSIIHITEGEIKYVMGHDWFYDAFVMEDDLLKMLRKDVIRDFAVYLADKMTKEDDNKVVPHHYVENMLKIYLNDNYNIQPPMQLKTNL